MCWDLVRPEQPCTRSHSLLHSKQLHACLGKKLKSERKPVSALGPGESLQTPARKMYTKIVQIPQQADQSKGDAWQASYFPALLFTPADLSLFVPLFQQLCSAHKLCSPASSLKILSPRTRPLSRLSSASFQFPWLLLRSAPTRRGGRLPTDALTPS